MPKRITDCVCRNCGKEFKESEAKKNWDYIGCPHCDSDDWFYLDKTETK